MKTIIIYALVDPRVPKYIRYVGKTARPEFRHLQHCTPGWGRNPKEEWVDTLRQEGLMPQMITLEVVPEDQFHQVEEKEKTWIASFPHEQLLNTRLRPLLPPKARKVIPGPPPGGSLSEKRDETERAMIIDALMDTDWNISYAAKRLGISRPTMYEKIERFKIQKCSLVSRKTTDSE